MSRGRKKKMPIYEQIENLKEEIGRKEAELAELRGKLEELETLAEDERREELIGAFYSSGKSLEDLMAFLNEPAG